MLVLSYSDPPSGSIRNLAITNYVTRVAWSGDTDNAARKLEFSVAFNEKYKDVSFQNLNLKLGGTVVASWIDDNGMKADIFTGRIFYRKRNSNAYTFDFVAYDNAIYLAKNKVHLVFYNAGANDAISKICNNIGLKLSGNNPALATKINSIVDGKSASEAIQMILDKVKADTGKQYTAASINESISIVERGTLVENYVASYLTGTISTAHGENYESMINRVEIWDEHGKYISSLTADDYVEEYGTLQEIYKAKPPVNGESVDNLKAASALLHYEDSESELEALGNVQCITGYSIYVKEDQLQGKFLIKSDNHIFENSKHTMRLALEYLPDNAASPKVTYG